MKIVFDPICLEYSVPEHPETSDRVKLVYEELKLNHEFVKPLPVSEADIERAHTKDHWKNVRDRKYEDADTPKLDLRYPLLSAGSAIKAADVLGFSLSRPPGHHAGIDFLGGFCYLNNIAIAVAKALPKYKKVAILDIDVHHGDGTQNIFFGKDKALYLSIHQSPLFPGTGLKSEGNCINYPLPSGTGEETYLKYLKKCIEEIRKFKPGLLAVSAGFDTYKKDPLAGFMLEQESYSKIGKMIKQINLPTFFVLEGGYSEDIGILARSLIDGFE